MTQRLLQLTGTIGIVPIFYFQTSVKKLYLNIYEGCQKSSWTLMIKASNEPDSDIHFYFSLK